MRIVVASTPCLKKAPRSYAGALSVSMETASRCVITVAYFRWQDADSAAYA